MPRYEVRVMRPEGQVLDRFGLSRLASDLASNDTGDPMDVASIRICRLSTNKFRVEYERTYHLVTEAENQLHALRTFLHLTDLPGNVDHTKIVVRLEEDPPAVAATGPIVPRQASAAADQVARTQAAVLETIGGRVGL